MYKYQSTFTSMHDALVLISCIGLIKNRYGTRLHILTYLHTTRNVVIQIEFIQFYFDKGQTYKIIKSERKFFKYIFLMNNNK